MPTISERILLCGLLLLLVMFLRPMHNASAQYGCPAISGGYEPKIIARENSSDVFVFWNYFYDCGQRALLFKKSTDNGNTFGNTIVIADSNTAGSAPAVSASLGSNYLYVAWFKYTQPSPTLFFKKSTDNGATFGEAVKIDTNDTIQDRIFGILASPTDNSNKIGVVWSGILANNGTDGVFLSKSLNGGKSFGQPILLGKSTSNFLLVPHLVQAGAKAYVLWSSAGESGEHFVTKINIGDNDGQFSIWPVVSLGNVGASAIAASGDDNVYIAGTTNSNSSTNSSSEGIASNGISIILLKSSDGGLDFDKPPTVLATYNNTDSNHINYLALDTSRNFVYLTWYNFHSPQVGSEIDARASSDYGNTFGNIQKINVGNNNASEPIVTSTSGERYYVSWQGFANDTSHQRLFFAASSDGGNTFGKPVDLTGNAGTSNPGQAMAADNDKNHVYIAWLNYAFKDGNHVMFTKNIDDGGNNFSNAIDLDEDSKTITEASSSPSPEFGTSFALMLIMAGAVGTILVATRIGWFGLKKS